MGWGKLIKAPELTVRLGRIVSLMVRTVRSDICSKSNMGALLENSDNSGIVSKLDAILANAKSFKEDDFRARMGLLRQIDDLYEALEPPINLVGLLTGI